MVEPQIFYATKSKKILVQKLLHMIFFGDGICVVRGEEGSGKTAIAAEISEPLAQADYLVEIQLTGESDPQSFYSDIVNRLGIHNDIDVKTGELIASLRSFSQSLVTENKLAVFLIDDAHYLDDQSLGALMSLLQGDESAGCGIKILLLSEDGLAERLDNLQILDTPVYDFEIENLSPSEVATFVNRYLGFQEFGAEDAQSLWSRTRGNPGRIVQTLNSEAQQESDVSVAESQTKSSLVPVGHIVAIMLLVGVLVWVYAAQDKNDVDSQVIESEVIESETIALHPTPIEDASLPTPEQTEVSELEEWLDDPITVPELTQDVALEPLNAATSSPNVAPIATPLPVKTSVPFVPPSYSKDEEFLLALPASHYVLQVLAASQPDSLRQYMQSQANENTLKMYRRKNDGRNWYVVIQGNYRDKDIAIKSVKTLPTSQSKAGPWPRKVEDLQKEIREFHR